MKTKGKQTNLACNTIIPRNQTTQVCKEKKTPTLIEDASKELGIT